MTLEDAALAQSPTELPKPFRKEQGHCWTVSADQFGIGDNMQDPSSSMLIVFEDGTMLGPSHTSHRDIRRLGAGRYSHWEKTLCFSSSDNTDPNTNGRKYSALLSPKAYFSQHVAYALQVTRSWLDHIPGGPGALQGKVVVEIGPGRDMGTILTMAALGAHVIAVDRFLADWTPSWHRPFTEALMEALSGLGWPVSMKPLERSLEIDGFDPEQIQCWRYPLEELPVDRIEPAHYTFSNATFEHLYDLPRAIDALFRASRPGSLGRHQIDFRNHNDFDHPLEFLLLDTDKFEEVFRGGNCSIGNRFRCSAVQKTLKDAGFIDIRVTVTERVDKEYLADLTKRLRGSRSKYQNATTQDLEIAGATFCFTRP
jgi:hypothetical protein